MDTFITRNFQTTIIQKAKNTMAEFSEDPELQPAMLFNICVHLEVCYVISDMNFLDEEGKAYTALEGQGKEQNLRPQYEVIEGMPRTIAWMVQRSLAQEHGIETPKYLADLFDYKTKRFIEVGITKGLADDYFWKKKEKLGNSMELMIFSYNQDYSLSNESSLDEEGKGRVLSRLTELQAELSLKNLWQVLIGEEDVEKGIDFKLGQTISRLRDISVPAGFSNFEGMRSYIDNIDPRGAIERNLARMSPLVSVTPKKLTWEDLRPIGPHIYDHELPEVPYNAFLLMSDELGLANMTEGKSKKPKTLAKECLEKYSTLRDQTDPILIMKSEKANENFLWKLWRDCVNTISNEETSNELQKTNYAKWATGDGLTYQKIMKEVAIDDETMCQEEPKIPNKCRVAAWVQTEMNLLSTLTSKRALDLPEIGPDIAPVEHVGSERRKYFVNEINYCKASTVMMKYVLFHTSLLNESNASMGKYKVIPITNRVVNEKGESFDMLYGLAVKGQSHLRGDTDVVTVVTFEFSSTDPRVDSGKWPKYTVFRIGSLFVSGREKSVYLYCRVNGTNKIQMKWGMEARRCLLQSMQQMEAIVEQESSIQGYDMTKACFKGDRVNSPKTFSIGTQEGKLVKGSFGKALRVIFTKCLMHYVFGNAQLEGFSAESRRLLLLIQALKDRKGPWVFDLEGMYSGIEECISNNPWVIQSVYWFNEWLGFEKEGSKVLESVDEIMDE
ncbi:polymerase PA [Influenza B virus (B/New York/1207/2009)]|uniref:Polymerase acidic protein n=1 Tax=Influenza B virus (B/New York/1207/2009) TaxID=1468981 RepID=X2E4R0_9INFB|nr:polymerase PA [Influenza B virus (B/New York/1207/2009)]